MKSTLILAAVAMACGAAFAQAPAGVTKTSPQEQNPNASGGKAQAKGEINAQAKGKDAGMSASVGAGATMGHKAMDLNGDGFISRKEWDSYHGKMWGGMKADKRGMVPWADVEARMKGGPN